MKKRSILLIVLLVTMGIPYSMPLIPVSADSDNPVVIDEIPIDFDQFWMELNEVATWRATPFNDDLEVIREYPTLTTQKIILNLTASLKARYTITFKINLPLIDCIETSQTSVTLVYMGYTIGFDFSDVEDMRLQHSHNTKGAKYVFIIQKDMEKGENLYVDPVIDTDPDLESAGGNNYQPHTFYAQGRYWVSYSAGVTEDELRYSSSVDGLTFETPSVLRVGGKYGNTFSVWNNATHMAYAWGNKIETTKVKFRLGALGTNGVITWVVAEQDATGVYSDMYYGIDIAKSTDNHFFIAFPNGTASTWDYILTKADASTAATGVWATSAGFPKVVNSTKGYMGGSMTPLANGDMFIATYNQTDYKQIGVHWDEGGDTLTYELIYTDLLETPWVHSCTSYGDTVYYAWRAYRPAGTVTVYASNKSFPAGSWSTPYAVHSEDTPIAGSGPCSSLTTDGSVYIVSMAWSISGVDKIWYRRYDTSTREWSDDVEVVEEDDRIHHPLISRFLNIGEGVGFFYVYGRSTEANIDVRFALARGVGNASITNMEGCGNWVFEGRTQYQFSITGTSASGGDAISLGMGFYDFAGDWYSFLYNHTLDRIVVTYPRDGISVGLGSTTVSGDDLTVIFNVMFNPTIVDTLDIDLYVRMDEPMLGDSGWFVFTADYFNIYNLGGNAEYSAPGPLWGRTTGGDVFDMYVRPLGGVFRANATYRNLQHVHFLVHWNVSDVWNGVIGVWNWTHFDVGTSRVTYGIDYCYNDTWIDGWEVRITHTRGTAGTLGWQANQAWVEFTVEWYNRGILIKTDKIYTLYESYLSTDSNTKVALWVDLWFNKINASTTVGGRVSAEYFGMEEKGWGPWASWSPISNGTGGGPANSQSMFFGNLQGDIGDTISCTELSMMKVWCYFEGIFCYHDQYLTEYDIFNVETERGSMRGIDTPVFVATKAPTMASTGFLQSLLGGMLEGMGRIWENAWMQAFVAWTWIVKMLDIFFTALGAPDLMSTMTTALVTWGDFFVESVVYVTTVIVQVFILLRAIVTPLFFWFTRFVTFFAGPNGLFVNVVKILDGTHTVVTGVVNVWELMNFSMWFDAVPILGFVAWVDSIDKRAKRMGGGWFAICIGDLQIVSWILAFIMDMMFRAITFVMDFAFNVARIIRG